MTTIAKREVRAEKTDIAVKEQVEITGDGPEPEQNAGIAKVEEHRDWEVLSRVPMLLTAGVAVPKFRVRDLLALKPGQMVESVAAISEEVPVKIGAVQLGWIEFEVVEQRMAVRLTRLA